MSLFILTTFGLGALAVWELGLSFLRFWEVACCMLAMPWAVWYDWQAAKARRLAHPDNNFHGLDLPSNAVGFDSNGVWILKGTRAALKFEQRRDKERRKLEAQFKRDKENGK